MGSAEGIRTSEHQRAQDDRLASLPDEEVLDLLGPEDGRAYEVIVQSMAEDVKDRGLDPAGAMLRRVVEKWNAKRKQ